jgi:hypothetical protein
VNEPLEQVEEFARELMIPRRGRYEQEETFRGRVARESTAILIQSINDSEIAKARVRFESKGK